MKTRVRKYGLWMVLIQLFPLLMVSCSIKKEGDRKKYPVPDENPVYFTYEAQTKSVFVEEITWVYALNPDTEIVEENNNISHTQGRWVIIANDWVRIRFGQNDLPNRTIEITVKENLTTESRSYSLEMAGFPGPIATVFLTIIQKGK